MIIEFTTGEFRQLLDMVYIGNWVLNSTRGNDRISEYDRIESKIFRQCENTALAPLVHSRFGMSFPSLAFHEGGIQEAIAYYEDAVFFDILAEELAKRDMGYPEITTENYGELIEHMELYLAEFLDNGVENVAVEPQGL